MKTTKKNIERKRIAIHRTNEHVYAQIIDDVKGETIISASDLELKSEKSKKSTKSDIAKMVGLLLAQKAKTKKIGKAYFDRRNYRYHGRVKALAEGAREGGLIF